MRHMKNPQLHFGEVNIADIKIDARSRDDVPAILKGLQYIYTDGEVIPHNEKVFSIFEEHTEWISTKSRRHEAKEKQASL